MPRYYFHMREGETLTLDPEGDEFATFEMAYAEAAASAREIVAQKILAGNSIAHQQFEITTAEGKVLEVISLRSIVDAARKT